MIIDPRHLRHLIAVAEAGSLMGAQDRLNLSQPAISNSISRLEQVVGARVLNRGRHGATLTPVGEILLRYGEGIENLLSEAEQEVCLHAAGIGGPLKIGGTTLPVISIIPAGVARLSLEAGPISVRIIEGSDEDIISKLESQEVDILVSTLGIGDTRGAFYETPLFTAGIFAIMRKGHPLSRRRQLKLSELKAFQFVVPLPGGAFRHQLEALFLIAGVDFPSAAICTSLPTVKEIVRTSDAVALLPKQAIHTDVKDDKLVSIKLNMSVGERIFGIRTLKGRKLSPVAQLFCKILLHIGPSFT